MLTSSNTTEAEAGDQVKREYKAGPRKRPPAHPGAIVASALKGLGVTPNAAAKAMKVTAQALGNIVNQKAAITPSMALRLGRYIDNGPEIWLALQADYDLWHAKKKLGFKLLMIKSAERADD